MVNENTIKYFVTALIVVILFSVLATYVATKSNSNELKTDNTFTGSVSEFILTDNGTANTLTQTPTSFTSATNKNRTWLNFDGIDDFVEIADNSYKTISYWVNDTSNAWIHVINTSNILYENGNEVASLTLNSIKQNSTGWFIGINSSDPFAGNIDRIRFYNDTINETVVNEIFDNGR